MKKRLLVVWLVLLISLAMFVPVLAWTGIEGKVVDSLTLQNWEYGGEVRVYGVQHGFYVSSTLPASPTVEYGEFSLTFPEYLTETTYYLIILYNSGPNGDAKTYVETLDAIPTGIGFNAGAIKTGTGPNAVTLTGLSAESANVWFPVGIVAGLSVLVMGALVVLRKR